MSSRSSLHNASLSAAVAAASVAAVTATAVVAVHRGLLGRHAHISKASETQSRRSVPETEQQVLKHSMLPSSNIRSVDMGVRHAVTRAYHAAQPISRGQPRCSPRQAVKQCLTNMRDLCVLSKQLLMGRSCPPITLLPSCQQRHGLGLAAAHGKLPRRF
jgi:hypothetical protein